MFKNLFRASYVPELHHFTEKKIDLKNSFVRHVIFTWSLAADLPFACHSLPTPVIRFKLYILKF